MTDDSQPDDDPSGGDGSAEESSGDAHIDEFFERIEEEPQPTEHSESLSPESPDQEGDRSTKRGRLWDSFSADRAAGRDGSSQPPDEPPEPPTESTPDEWVTDDPPDSSQPPSEEPTPDEPGGSSSPADSPSDPDSDPGATDPDEGRSSFRTILERISHRIGSVGSGSADEDTAETASADAASADTPADADSADPTQATDSPGPTPESASAGRSASSSARSDTIDEILNNIDLFGRATSSSQVLLLSPTAHSITNDIYSRFLLPTDGAGQNILFVSATQSASDQLASAQHIPHWREGKTAVIEVGQSTLKPTRPGGGEDVTRQLDIYKQISNLKHLAKLGINISHIVSQWDNSRRPTVVGVHTLSAIQQYVGNETMFQFLFTLKGQLNSMGVMGFYHMDPSVHTDNEISTIQSAFDLVITVSSDGSVDIL